jgi:hypothetical protein
LARAIATNIARFPIKNAAARVLLDSPFCRWDAGGVRAEIISAGGSSAQTQLRSTSRVLSLDARRL